ncbi:MAG: pyrroline-5-carboxylate reductase [Candidatus Aenigmatarchaeota archaeon]
MKKKIKIGIVGFGNMGRSLGEVLKDKPEYCIFVFDKDSSKLNIKNFYICRNNEELIRNSEVLILAIKPQDLKDFIDKEKKYILENRPLIISILAGVPTNFFEKYLKNIKVIRVMPNLAIKVKEGISFISKGKFSTKQDLEIAKNIFSLTGDTFIVKENFIDKITSITGSGPGYIYYIMDCIYKTALKFGFGKELSKKMVIKTFLGAVKLAEISGKDFSVLVKEVASKKGTTQEALKIFNKKNLSNIFSCAINSAYLRAKTLSRIFN